MLLALKVITIVYISFSISDNQFMCEEENFGPTHEQWLSTPIFLTSIPDILSRVVTTAGASVRQEIALVPQRQCKNWARFLQYALYVEFYGGSKSRRREFWPQSVDTSEVFYFSLSPWMSSPSILARWSFYAISKRLELHSYSSAWESPPLSCIALSLRHRESSTKRPPSDLDFGPRFLHLTSASPFVHTHPIENVRKKAIVLSPCTHPFHCNLLCHFQNE